MIAVLALLLGSGQPDAFTMTMSVRPDSPEGQRLLALRAAEICGGRLPQLGRYRFDGREEVTPGGERQSRFDVRQELTCGDSPPPAPAAPPVPSDWQPSPADEQRVTALTERYFSLIDAGDARAVQQLWIEDEQAAVPLPERAANISEFRARAGAPGRHRVVRITWYVNPPAAPRPGVYAAVDYERSYSGLYLNCGYLIWFRGAGGDYALVREETNILSRVDGPIAPEALADIRRQMLCDGR